jgi:cobalt transporter subunit CbtA
MFARIVFSAALAGLLAGLTWSGLQAVRVAPIILEAETFEASAPAPAGEASAAHAHAATGGRVLDQGTGWAPSDGLERIFYTGLGNVLTAVGFALLLTAAFALRGGATGREGLLWGLAGFATFQLAPAIGLPPEIPGAYAAPLVDRQLWWLATVAVTGIGLALVFLREGVAGRVIGVGLVALPHVVGAPQPEEHGGLASPELARAFVVASLVTNAVFWVVLGGLAAFFFDLLGRGRPMRLSPSAR